VIQILDYDDIESSYQYTFSENSVLHLTSICHGEPVEPFWVDYALFFDKLRITHAHFPKKSNAIFDTYTNAVSTSTKEISNN